MNPYLDLELADGTIFRFFDEETDEWDLVWHRDERDRKVTVRKGLGWKIQFDNELPVEMGEGDDIYIKAMEYHRIIKGIGPLELLIEEYQ